MVMSGAWKGGGLAEDTYTARQSGAPSGPFRLLATAVTCSQSAALGHSTSAPSRAILRPSKPYKLKIMA